MTPSLSHLQSIIDAPDIGERYEVHEQIGRGGMGVVYRVTDRVLARDVAVKVSSAVLHHDDASRRLLREARVLALLEHPGIVAVHDAGLTSDGRPWYAMRLVRGTTLTEWARAQTPGERLRLFVQLCDIIAFAHDRHVLHRDIKPQNVMVGDFGQVYVLDWGVARVPSDDVHSVGDITGPVTRDGAVVGTPGYMSPEQAGGSAEVDVRTDVYSLGVVLRELCGDEAPAPLKAVIRQATASDAGDRYQRVVDMSRDVRHFLDAEPVSAYRERWWERLARFYSKNSAVILLFAAYVIVRMVILLWRGV